VIEHKSNEVYHMIECKEKKIEEEILDYLIHLQILKSKELK